MQNEFRYRPKLDDRKLRELRKEHWARIAERELATFERTGIPPGLQ